MKLHDIAFARSGDKGQTCNICVFPYDEDDFEWLRGALTENLVASRFGALVAGTVSRYEFPNLRGFNFVLTEALAGGVSISLRIDPHGKTFQSLMLDIDVGDRPTAPSS
jgi:hypothetical protein